MLLAIVGSLREVDQGSVSVILDQHASILSFFFELLLGPDPLFKFLILLSQLVHDCFVHLDDFPCFFEITACLLVLKLPLIGLSLSKTQLLNNLLTLLVLTLMPFAHSSSHVALKFVDSFD